LVENGANVNGKEAPLVYAARNKDTAVLEYLISKGAKIESKDSYGNTALMSAIGNWNVDAILLLEKHNANWKAVNKNGENLFHVLSYGAFLDNVKVDDNGKLVDAFTELKGKNIIEYLISKGIDINKKDKEDGYTPLMNVIASTSRKSSKANYVVENFLKYGADPNIKDKYGYTALFDSVDRSELVKILLKYGANPKAKVDGETPLEYAKSELEGYPSKRSELNKTIEILSKLENE
ncbi:MAG: ankyrin repeat domain-containing protein, partial [Treponema sp.]|nr:ankyrin repeat domain-containing protein [Treponema sp.]